MQLPEDPLTLRKVVQENGQRPPGSSGFGYVASAIRDKDYKPFVLDSQKVATMWPVGSYDQEHDRWVVDGDGFRLQNGQIAENFPLSEGRKGETKYEDTGIEELKIEMVDSSYYRIIDLSRQIHGKWVAYRGIATLQMPDNLKSAETGRGFWMYVIQYYAGILPIETLLEVY